MPDRDLDISKFSFFAYRKLKKALGEFDAVVECNEIAIREFIQHSKKEGSSNYIQRLSDIHSIRVDEVDFLKFETRVGQYNIASVFQQAEQFMKDFKSEWKTYYDKEWLKKNDGETVLQNCIRNLPMDLSSNVIEIYDYYRLIRNFISHNDRDLEKINRLHKKINFNTNDFPFELNLENIPNSYDKIDFNDFLLATNIVKHIAFVFSTSSKPDNDRIAEILYRKSKEDEQRTFKGLKKLKNNSERFDKATKNYIKSIFGRFSQSDENEIAEKLKSLLA